MESYKVLRMESLDLPDRDKADALLRSVADWVQPIMKKRQWTVPLLQGQLFPVSRRATFVLIL
jgi:hypothetical protein